MLQRMLANSAAGIFALRVGLVPCHRSAGVKERQSRSVGCLGVIHSVRKQKALWWNDLPIRRLSQREGRYPGMTMAVRAAKLEGDDPVTLHRIMQNIVGEGLKERYEPPQKLSHELFVLMLQLKEQERRKKLAKPPPQAW
jgi:hypothetical protein